MVPIVPGGAQLRAHGGLDGRHQQRRRNAFSGHVANRKCQRIIGKRHEVVIVSRDHARRVAHAFQFQSFGERNILRKKLVLHFPRNGQFRFQPLLFLSHHN